MWTLAFEDSEVDALLAGQPVHKQYAQGLLGSEFPDRERIPVGTKGHHVYGEVIGTKFDLTKDDQVVSSGRPLFVRVVANWSEQRGSGRRRMHSTYHYDFRLVDVTPTRRE